VIHLFLKAEGTPRKLATPISGTCTCAQLRLITVIGKSSNSEWMECYNTQNYWIFRELLAAWVEHILHVVSEGLWWWWITQGISGFLDVIHHPVFEETRRFGNWICFRPQVKGGKKTPTQLGPLERANLNHWTNTERWIKSRNPEIPHMTCYGNYGCVVVASILGVPPA
jgi:hypothetical protein